MERIRPRIRGQPVVPESHVREFYEAARKAAKKLILHPRYPLAEYGQVAHKALAAAEAKRDVDVGKAAKYAAKVVQEMMTH